MTTTSRKDDILEWFTNASTGDSYCNNRLMTEEIVGGNVGLIAYRWQKIAEFDPQNDEGELYVGHREASGKTVSRYLNEAQEAMEDAGISVEETQESPLVAPPPECVKYIDNYVGDFEDLSAVDEAAIESVKRSLDFL